MDLEANLGPPRCIVYDYPRFVENRHLCSEIIHMFVKKQRLLQRLQNLKTGSLCFLIFNDVNGTPRERVAGKGPQRPDDPCYQPAVAALSIDLARAEVATARHELALVPYFFLERLSKQKNWNNSYK